MVHDGSVAGKKIQENLNLFLKLRQVHFYFIIKDKKILTSTFPEVENSVVSLK